MPSLTAGEAAVRSRSLSVLSYDIDLDLTSGDTHFLSSSVIEFESLDHQDTFVEIAGEVLDVHLNQVRLDPGSWREGRLHLTDLRDTNVVVIQAKMAYSHDGEGLHRSVDPEDNRVYVYAMTFLDNAPRIFACFDQPDLKAPFRLRVTAPPAWTAVSNGRGTQTAPGDWSFAQTLPMSTYLVALVAGPYHSVLGEYDGIPLGLHCRQSLAPYLDEDADELFEVTRQCLDEYHRLFGIRYPFGEYHQAFVPEFNAGAMESPACVTFRDDMVFRAAATDSARASRAMVIAHEMAHMWFGDLVTMQWWDDLWLNESFADYMGYRVTSEVTRFTDVLVEFSLVRKSWGMAADQRSTTHPIAGNGVGDTAAALSDFDGISYAKGAAVLRQLNTFLGEDAFLQGVVDHLRRHAFGNARLADLIESWQRCTDADVAGWAEAWLRTAGIDSLACRTGDEGPEILRSNGSVNSSVVRPHALTVGLVADDGTIASIPLVVEDAVTSLRFPMYDPTAFVLVDTGDEAWAKISLDPDTTPRIGTLLSRISDPVARVAMWGAVREGVLDGLVTPDQYVGMLEEALPHESDLTVESLLVRSIHSWLGTYLTAPEHRDRISALVATILDHAHRGSNRQLLAARALIDVTPDLDRLRAWRADETPEGVAVDDDFRWRVLRALAQTGHADQADVDEQSRRDPSSQGALHALASTASMPDAASKSAVWERLVSDESLNNYDAFTLAEHFFKPGQSGVTAGFVDRYFTELAATTRFRPAPMVELIMTLGYPRYATDAATVAAAEACLSRDLETGVRRAVVDRTDDLRRLLVARARASGSPLD